MTNCCGNPECKRPFGLVRRSWYFEASNPLGMFYPWNPTVSC